MNQIKSIFMAAFLMIVPMVGSHFAYAEDVVKPSFSVRKDPATGLDQLIIHQRGEEKVLGTIKQIRAGEVFFHWGDKESYFRWTGPEGLNDSEFRAMRENFQGQAAGGGFYVSRDPFDSITFGEKCTKVVAPRDLKYFSGPAFFLNSKEIALIFPNVKKEMSMGQITSLILEQYGVDAWEYASGQKDATWLNFIRRDALGGIRPVNPSDQMNAFLKEGQKNIFHWIVYDQNVGLPKAEEFRRADPDLYAYFMEGDRTPERMKAIRTRLIKEWLETPLEQNDLRSSYLKIAFKSDFARASLTAPTLLNALRKDFKSDIEASVLSLIEKAKSSYQSTEMSTLKLNGLFLGVAPERLGLPPEGLTFAMVPQIRYSISAIQTAENEFQSSLRRAIQYMDISDLVPEMAKGNPAPWKIYDEPGKTHFADRWKNAVRNFQLAAPWYTSFSTTNAKKMEMMILTSGQLTEDPHVKLRSTAALGEGNIIVQGKRYYRIAAWKKDRLLSHPLLVAEVIPDPDHKGSFLARHEYPSARTYRKFETLLSPELRKELYAAEKSGKLASANTPEFQSLTESIVKELLLAAPNDSKADFHWWASAVFPLGKDTDRALNVSYYMANYNAPKPIRNWRESLFYSKEEFELVCESEGFFLDDLIRACDSRALLTNPTFPDFYGHSPLFDIYFNHPGLTPPGDPWRAKTIQYLNSEEGQRAISEERVMTSSDSKDCVALLRPVGVH